MESMYRGKERFTEEQLIFIVEAMLSAVMDKVESYYPPTITINEYYENSDEIQSMMQGAKSVVGIFIPILWAQLNHEGMGTNDFIGYHEFENVISKYVKECIKNSLKNHEDLEWPDFRRTAELIVWQNFQEYLNNDLPRSEEDIEEEAEGYDWP